jgi:hypothetical protein
MLEDFLEAQPWDHIKPLIDSSAPTEAFKLSVECKYMPGMDQAFRNPRFNPGVYTLAPLVRSDFEFVRGVLHRYNYRINMVLFLQMLIGHGRKHLARYVYDKYNVKLDVPDIRSKVHARTATYYSKDIIFHRIALRSRGPLFALRASADQQVSRRVGCLSAKFRSLPANDNL